MARKKQTKKQSEGLGDTVEKITKATGIDKLVKFVAGEDCGCEERKVKLNSLFRYKEPKCLLEHEYKYLTLWYRERRNKVTTSDQQTLLKIYNRVFSAQQEPTSCADCFKRMLNDLQKVYDSYESL
jgi:hypothetical protein